jgi:hypothetical protein
MSDMAIYHHSPHLFAVFWPAPAPARASSVQNLWINQDMGPSAVAGLPYSTA